MLVILTLASMADAFFQWMAIDVNVILAFMAHNANTVVLDYYLYVAIFKVVSYIRIT